MTLLQTSVAAGASGPLIVLSGVADISTITQLSGVITSQLSEITRQLMIDVSGLRFADSAAIALLLVVARTLKGQGGTMVLIWPQPAVARAVTLADPRQIIMIQGSTPRTPESEGGGSPELGPRCRDLPTADYAAADQAELEKIIEPTRYFRAKGKTLISPGQALCDRFGGDAPDTLVELVTLPHVGRKTANVILGDAFGKPSIVVDTRFTRPARRFGWTAQTDPDMIECDVAALLPPREWTAASHRVIWHGRRVCHARRPACGACGVARRCPSFGAGPTDEATARTLVKTGPFS